MKQLLITIAAVVLVGCGESQQSTPSPETKPVEPVAAQAAQPEPPTAKAPDISIHKAAGGRNIEAVKQHLAAGTDVNARDKLDRTALHHAASSGFKKIAELLIAKGADVNAQDKHGKTPLDDPSTFYGMGLRYNETVDLLHKYGGKTGKELKAQGKPIEPVAVAATSKPEPKTVKAPSISIHGAAKEGNIEAVKKHLAAGADVNAKDRYGYTALGRAVSVGHKETAELLIAKGADVNITALGKTLLDTAIKRKHTEIADLLRKHGGKKAAKPEPTKTKAPPSFSKIHTAAQMGMIELVKQHLAVGEDVNAKGVLFKGTPLHSAAMGGRKEVIELLIAKGADLNAKDSRGRTPLDWAISQFQTKTADLLRKHGGKTGEELKAEGK